MSDFTKEEIIKIYNDHEDEHDENNSEDPFLEGLQIISKHSIVHNYGSDGYKFYAANLEEMDGLYEEVIRKLNKLGWSFDEEYNCFVKSF